MAKKPKVIVVMPAYNAAKTLGVSYRRLPKEYVDEVILVDDASTDDTYAVAKKLPITVYRNTINLGYGGNLKVCLTRALERQGDIIIEFHPDNQYDPSDLPQFLKKAREGYDFALGSRFVHPKEALDHHMPVVKFIANRVMSFIDEFVLGLELSEFHSGFRLYTRKLLETVPYRENSDDYLFSFEIIVQAVYKRLRIAEVPISCDYHPQMHTANLKNSTIYALGTFKTLYQYMLSKFGGKRSGPFVDIKPEKCPLCLENLTSRKAITRDPVSGKIFTIWFCTPCQTGFTLPVPKDFALFYPSTYYSNIKSILYRHLQGRRLHLLKETVKKGHKVLDIGCGDGSMGEQIRKIGLNYAGIEAPFAKNSHHDIKYVGIEGMREKTSSYRAVTFWETLEHLSKPDLALGKAKKALLSGGHIIIECPNWGSGERSFFGSNWFHFDPPRHLFHFSKKGLQRLLEKHGLKVISQEEIFAMEYIPYGFAQSVLYTLSRSLSILGQGKRGQWQMLLLAIVLTLLLFVTTPVTFLIYLFGNSPILLTVAKKIK